MSRFLTGHLLLSVLVATLAALACAVAPAFAGTNVTTPVQQVQTPVFVTAPHIDQIGDDLSQCRSMYSRYYPPAVLASCINSLLAGGVEISIKWSGTGCPQPCATSVSSFTVYRVPASLVVRTDVQVVPPAGPQRSAGAPAGAQAPAPGAIAHVAQMPAPISMTDHVVVVSSNDWSQSWFGLYALAVVPNPRVGDCFVARVSTSDRAQSADSNKACIDGSVKFGTEVSQYKSTSGSGSFTIMNANNCYASWTSYGHGSGVGSVGWQLYSTTAANATAPNGAPCTGIQVLQTSYGFELGNIPLPIVKAELMSIGDASCVSEVDVGGAKFQVPQQPSLDQDVTSGVGATQVTATFIPHPRAGALPLENGCLSQLQGAVLKVTRLK